MLPIVFVVAKTCWMHRHILVPSFILITPLSRCHLIVEVLPHTYARLALDALMWTRGDVSENARTAHASPSIGHII
jgi:hypothetical protein